MRPRHRTTVIAALVVAAVATATVAIAAPGTTRTPTGTTPTAATTTADPSSGPPVNLVSVCNFSHAAPDDPIVLPDEPGAAHLHQFFGNTSTAADSTPDSLAAAGTTCSRLEDTAAYWVPALYDDGELQRPARAQAYYTLAGKDPDTITAFPADLRVIAGGAEGPDAAMRWGCADTEDREPLATTTTVPTCEDGEFLAARIVFPDCWDGDRTDSADHRSHLAYSVRGTCPDSHPVEVPRLRLTIRYPGADGGDDVQLASGGPETLHADFLNAWDQDALEQLVEDCLAAEQRCGIVGGPGGR